MQGDLLATASQDNTVGLFALPSGEFKKHIIRGSTPIRHVSFSSNGKEIAVASEYISTTTKSEDFAADWDLFI